MSTVPANLFWQVFTGDQSRFAVGSGRSRRYAPGFSAIAGFENLEEPDLDALRDVSVLGDRIYTDGWSGNHNHHWQIARETTMWKMVHRGSWPEPVEDEVVTRLTSEHSQQALDLALLTNPGPFGPRTLELGEYFGILDGGRLVAMAGERTQLGTLRELSGVCTHPDYLGRGYAAMLSNKVIRLQAQRGQTTFLHVISNNEAARRLYTKLGFVEDLESVVRLIELVS